MNPLRRWVHKIGWDLHRYRPDVDPWVQLCRQLRSHAVNLVLDVGANIGQFAVELRQHGYAGRIVSFEPLSRAHKTLSAAAGRDPLWTIAERMAIGAECGTAKLNVSAISEASSLMPMLDTHIQAAPGSVYITCEHVPLKTLDSAAGPELRPDDIIFIKIDTQGYQEEVLKGAVETLHRAIGLQVELSLVSLYEGECLFDPMLQQVNSAGYELWNLVPGFTDPRTGRLLQCDAVFFRTPSMKNGQTGALLPIYCTS